MSNGLPRQDDEIVHLKAEPGLHFDVHVLKRRKVHVLHVPHGGMNMGDVEPEVVCGTSAWRRRVTMQKANEVTCPRCRRMLPKEPVNPRSGMAMPRPGR